MRPPPPRSTLFPYTTLYRSLPVYPEIVLHVSFEVPVNYVIDRPRRLLAVAVHIAQQCVGIAIARIRNGVRSEEHTSELQSHSDLVCRLLLEKKQSNRASSTI